MIFKPIIPIYAIIIILATSIIAVIVCAINRKCRKSNNFIRLGILVLLSLTLLRPIVPFETKAQSVRSNTVLYFIVDNTGSMAVEDEDGKARIKALSADMEKIIDSFGAIKVGIFTQDVLTYQMMPVSSDIKTAINLAKNLGPKNTSSSEGTDLNKLIKEAANYINSYTEAKNGAEVIIFVMSDGENAINGSQNYSLTKGDFNSFAYGAVIGYGSEEGGKVPNYAAFLDANSGVLVYHKQPSKPFVTDENNNEVISKIDEQSLKSIASLYGFEYRKSTDGIDQVIQAAKEKAGKTTYLDETIDISNTFELYWIFAMLAGVLMLIEFSRDFNNILAEQEVKK